MPTKKLKKTYRDPNTIASVGYTGIKQSPVDLGTGEVAYRAPQQVAATPVVDSPATKSVDGLGVLKDLAPFASNMANAFRKPPKPPRPGALKPVTLSKMELSNERTEADRLIRGADLGAERGLDGNTAASVRAGNLSQKFRMYSDSYSRENNANTDITNKQALINSSIEEKNVRSNDYYNQQVTESKIAQQNQQSANLANAADKFTAIQNEKGKRDLEAKNFAITSKVFENSGVLKRLMKKLSDEGIEDPSNTKKFGGKLKRAFK